MQANIYFLDPKLVTTQVLTKYSVAICYSCVHIADG